MHIRTSILTLSVTLLAVAAMAEPCHAQLFGGGGLLGGGGFGGGGFGGGRPLLGGGGFGGGRPILGGGAPIMRPIATYHSSTDHPSTDRKACSGTTSHRWRRIGTHSRRWTVGWSKSTSVPPCTG